MHYVDGIPRKRPVTRGDGRNRFVERVLEEYQAARREWEARCEVYAIGYATEECEFRLLCPAPTFKAFLIGSREEAS